MKTIGIVEISGNDGWQVAARKINDNFRKVNDSLTVNLTTGIDVSAAALAQKIKDAEDRLDGKIDEAEARIDEKVSQAVDLIDQRLDELGQLLDDKTQAKLFAPPVGTYMFSEANPATSWPGTTWEQVAEGLYLVSAGTTYKPGTRHGSNKVTLAATQMPQHTHTGPSHTHSGPSHTHTGPSHTHSGPSHTHTVSGTAADSGNHWHWLRNNSGYGLYSGGNLPPSSSSQTNGPWWGGGFGGTEGWADWAGTHSHSVSGTAAASGTGATGAAGTGKTGASGTGQTGQAGTGATGTSGGGQAHENMPASIAVPLWRRTA